MKKCDLGDSELLMVVGAKWSGLTFSGAVDLMGFSHTTTSWSEKEKISSKLQFCEGLKENIQTASGRQQQLK